MKQFPANHKAIGPLINFRLDIAKLQETPDKLAPRSNSPLHSEVYWVAIVLLYTSKLGVWVDHALIPRATFCRLRFRVLQFLLDSFFISKLKVRLNLFVNGLSGLSISSLIHPMICLRNLKLESPAMAEVIKTACKTSSHLRKQHLLPWAKSITQPGQQGFKISPR
jgi:hypothetical protein